MGKFKLNNDLAIGTGVGIGTVQILAVGKYLPGRLYPIFGNIVIGGLALAASMYKWKTGTTHNMALAYGFTTLFGGLASGIMDAAGWAARQASMGRPRPGAPRMGRNGYFTSSYYPGSRGSFYRRPQSRARGFASDVTRNPMAAIPTEMYYGKQIIA